MSKYSYRATAFQQVDWALVQAQAGAGRLVFAVDVAKHDFVGSVLDERRRVVLTVKWRHPQQSRALVERVASLGCVEAVLEPSGSYGDALRGLLREAGMSVYRVSAKRVHDAAEVYDGVPSLHDAKSAYVIGRLHLEGVSRVWEEPDARRRALTARLRRLEMYQERGQRAYNRLEALVARHWPEATEILGLESVSLLRLLSCYGAPAAVAADAEAARELLQRSGGRFLQAEKVEALVASAATSVGVACIEAEAELISELADELLETRKACRALEKSLARAVDEDAALGAQAQAVGHTTAVVLRSALGDAQAYGDAASYEKAAGLNLRERSSGKHQGKLKLTKRGPGVVRLYLYLAVLRQISRPGPVREWYEAKVARDGGRVKAKAITALMRKLIRALWHVGQGQAFEPARMCTPRSSARAAA